MRMVFVSAQMVAFSLRRWAGSLGIIITTRECGAGCMHAVLGLRRAVTAARYLLPQSAHHHARVASGEVQHRYTMHCSLLWEGGRTSRAAPVDRWTLYGHKTHPDNRNWPQTTRVRSRGSSRQSVLLTNNHNYGPRISGFGVAAPSTDDHPRRVAGVNGA
jgi:hypothetical protein